MTDEQLRLDADLIAVLRAGVTHAVENGADFVAPPHLMLALLADPRVGPAIAPLVPHAVVERAAREPGTNPPPRADGVPPPFTRRESLAFCSQDGTRTLYLDAESYRLFIEGARRAVGVYRAKHLVYGFTAEAVKDQALLGLFGSDPQAVSKAVEGL